MKLPEKEIEEFIPDVLIPSEKDMKCGMVKSVVRERNFFPLVYVPSERRFIQMERPIR